jgi:hypothetical protein
MGMLLMKKFRPFVPGVMRRRRRGRKWRRRRRKWITRGEGLGVEGWWRRGGGGGRGRDTTAGLVLFMTTAAHIKPHATRTGSNVTVVHFCN